MEMEVNLHLNGNLFENPHIHPYSIYFRMIIDRMDVHQNMGRGLNPSGLSWIF
jgi:hypothetical protein